MEFRDAVLTYLMIVALKEREEVQLWKIKHRPSEWRISTNKHIMCFKGRGM